jgi:LacI family transcriptional regulator
MTMPRINQHWLASQLNLSQTTVSRALANHPAINATTKAQVWDLAAQHGYRFAPSRRAGGRISSEPMVIGVLIAIPTRERGHAETSQLVLRGIAERGSSEVVTLDVLYQEPADHSPGVLQKRMRQRRWKACILIHPMVPELVAMLARTVPCVSVVENYRIDYLDSVDVDQIEAVGSLVRRLHAAEHRHIGFLSWVYDVPTPWVFHRFGSYVETMFQLGLPFDPDCVINVQGGQAFSAQEVADIAAARIRAGTTAFVCAADHQAYLLRRLLRKAGLRVPEDVSLTGFDGIEPDKGESQIATVRVPYEEIGRSALHQLLRRISFPTAPRRHVLVDGELLEGTSIAAIPQPGR